MFRPWKFCRILVLPTIILLAHLSVNRIHMKEKKYKPFALNMLLFFEIYIFEKNMLLLCMGCC